MIRKILTATLASAAMAVAAPAVAGPGHGNGGGVGGGIGAGANMGGIGGPSQAGLSARMNSQGPLNASPTGISHASPNSVLNSGTTTTTNTRAVNSQGLMHSSTNGIARANSNSVLARGGIQGTALPGLAQNLNVVNANGTTIGTVRQVVYGNDGSVRLVTVQSPTGQIYRLAPNTLSISGTTVTTTSPIGG